jgi:Xaa-Pro aminopeptidase
MHIKCLYLTVIIICVGTIPACGADTDERVTESKPAPHDYGVPDVRNQVDLKRIIVEKKLNDILPTAMRAHGIDMWIVIDRENNEDPLHDEIGGRYSGVRGAFIFFDRGSDGIEKIFVGSHVEPSTAISPHVYDSLSYYGYSKDGLTPIIRKLVHERQPVKIGINQSSTLPEADGLTAGLLEFLKDALGAEYAERFTSAELLVRDFRLQRLPEETEVFTDLVKWTDRWMKDGFAKVVPGETTAADLFWLMEQRAQEVRLDTGASGSNVARIVREGEQLPLASDHPIEPGDIVSIDSGLKYLGYETDFKRTAYVLKPGETEPPESIRAAWQTTLSMSDVYIKEMVPGRVGHEVWAAIVEQARELGYRVVGPDAGGRAATDVRPEIGVYGHSVGNNSHDIGARIAEDLPFAYGERVRFPLVESEFVSVEFHLSTPIPEWGGKTWYSRFEENARQGAQTIEWLIPRQEKLILIQPEGGLKTT